MQHTLQTHILRAHMLLQRPMLLRGCVLLDKANWVSGALAWRSEPLPYSTSTLHVWTRHWPLQNQARGSREKVCLLKEHRHWPLQNQARGSRLGSL